MKFKQTVLAGSIMLATTLTPMIDAQAENKKFNDVPQDHWSFNAITDLANKNIVAGYGNGIFGLGDNITRGQVARMIYNYLKPADDPNVKNPFTDVKGHMFEKEILSLSKAGIMSGYGDGNFGPDNILTREQLAAVLTRAFNLKATATTTFKDVEKNYWATNAISALQENKIAAGTGNNMFEPKMVVTREQYAQFLYNAINMKEKPTTEPEKNKNGGAITEPDKPEKDKNDGTTTNPVDLLPPTLKKVEVEKQTYKAGETVQVSIEAEDDVSGVSYAYVAIKGATGEEKEVAATYNEKSNKWIADIPLSSYANPGEYVVKTVLLYDNANHAKVYWGGKDFNVHFKVENNTVADQSPPTLKKIEIEKQTYKAGETVQVSIEAEDDVSGVSYAYVAIKGATGEEKEVAATYNEKSNKWIADIPLSSYANPGEYVVKTVLLYDNANHAKVYWGGQDFNIHFKVENDRVVDQLPPALKNIGVEKQIYKAGETVQVSIEAEDDVSGVSYAYVAIKGATGEEKEVAATYNEKSNKWIADIPLSSYANPGEYVVKTVLLYDNANHAKVYWGGQDFNVFFNVIKS
ncbi:S-layer homology domain-containing protein (plasmid) [Bacillus thuringiensis serovar fukuokaensis]|nr:S-layer protein [Bacillus thuringiensis serovar sumiyoshiensis]OTW95182.1 S-layer protein [Bacillus thuringiensis serovar fukuokaensis]